jgi:hypothetical protein
LETEHSRQRERGRGRERGRERREGKLASLIFSLTLSALNTRKPEKVAVVYRVCKCVSVCHSTLTVAKMANKRCSELSLEQAEPKGTQEGNVGFEGTGIRGERARE